MTYSRHRWRCSLSLFLLIYRVLSFQPQPLAFPANGRLSGRGRLSKAMVSLSLDPECLQATTELEFSDELWDSYVKAMTEVMQSKRVLKKDKVEDMEIVQNYLVSKRTLSDIPSPMDLDPEHVLNAMNEQSKIFQTHYNFTQQQYNYAMRSLVYFGDSCAKNQVGLPVVVSWHKMLEGGMVPRENSISTYMYILSLEDNSTACHETLDELATFHDLVYAPSEKTVFLRMKNLIAKNDIMAAEKILSSLPDKGSGGEWKRLRTFLPMLEHYCGVGDVSSILRLFREMRQSPGVYLDADTYALIISSLARSRIFCPTAEAIEGHREAGFESSHGPALFDELCKEMGEDILELTELAAKEIAKGLVEGFGGSVESIQSMVDETIAPGLHIAKVVIDRVTGLCPASGAKLRLFRLDEEQRQHVHDTLLEMSRMSYKNFTTNRKTSSEEDQDYGFQQLSRFSEWLDSREGDPFTAIVDGANVAYFGFATMHFSQVKRVVDELKRMGENPLVILPKKYTNRKFLLSRRRHLQTLDDRDYAVIKSLEAENMLYVVPPRCLDDYFWMLASVSNQTIARGKCDLQVSPENAAGRFLGLRPMLVTNDQMRDHKLDLLEPREFRRWCSCHIVNYDLSPYTQDEWNDERSVLFSPADFFSREIQGNSHENDQDFVWHFPVTEWDEPTRLCIWMDRSSS